VVLHFFFTQPTYHFLDTYPITFVFIVGIAITASVIQGIFTGIINTMKPGAFENGKLLSLSTTREILRNYCNMSYKRVTGKTLQLPKDWKTQMHYMAARIAYFMAVNNSPLELVVNSDQTGIHLVPNAGEYVSRYLFTFCHF
jgi:hypothetical protein